MTRRSFQNKQNAAKEERDKKGKYFPKNLPTILKHELEQGRTPTMEISNDKDGYFLYGSTGSGKSYEAACIMTEIAKRRNMLNGGDWINVPKLLHRIKKSFGTNEEDLIEKYSNVPLLCLDDLGAEQGSEWVMQTLYIIINSRYEEMLTTIITSNLSFAELSKKMEDDRLISRITSMCHIVHMNRKDRRKEKRRV